ncbi:hypothetical protein VDIAB_110487 [Vibrio diabolicus]|nr:hypothetical protein VDIAB_110487 [Vibrio diabolicus]
MRTFKAFLIFYFQIYFENVFNRNRFFPLSHEVMLLHSLNSLIGEPHGYRTSCKISLLNESV